MPVEKRKLVEVSLPLDAINRESVRERSIRQGHPSTLHLWWARRPLAACRAVLFAQLVDDPSAHPDRFPDEESQVKERERLFDLIRRLVVWESTLDGTTLTEARAEIAACFDGEPPSVVDPFAGGGSIPLEAQRFGLTAHASDLNPVAVLICKAMIEIPARFAGRPPVHPGAAEGHLATWPGTTGLAEDVRRYGGWMRDEARRRIGHLYPTATLPEGSEAKIIAWLWARTVACPNPACGIAMPLVRSWWLGKKKGKEAYVVPRVAGRRVEFSIGHDPTAAPASGRDGTVTGNGVVCVGCRSVVPLSYVRAEGKAHRTGAQLMAIVAAGSRRRHYLAPIPAHERAAEVSVPDGVPDTELPEAALGFRVQGYGMTRHADLFTPRQLVALTTFTDLVREARERVYTDARTAGLPDGDQLATGGDGAAGYADAVTTYLGLAVSRTVAANTCLNTWNSATSKEGVNNIFKLQTLSMTWDHAESNPFQDRPADPGKSAGWIARAIRRFDPRVMGFARQAGAADRTYAGSLVATDPPYYDNVGYADLSDFFYVWLRRSLGGIQPSLFGTVLTPKADDLVADPFRRGGKRQAQQHFDDGFLRVFERVRRGGRQDLPMTLFYAFKQAETDAEGTTSTGWERLLEAMVGAGWKITATWPMRTERSGRPRSNSSNALASSVLLACRPLPAGAPSTTRRSFLAALRRELPDKLRVLQQGGIAPVDLAQAAIGPGMSVFSRHARVVEPDGSRMPVRTALAMVNRALDEVLSQQEGDFDTDTRFCLKWFTQYGWGEAGFPEAEQLARATNTSVAGLARGGVFVAHEGSARLIPPGELDRDWDPVRDNRISEWEVALRLAWRLHADGVAPAAELMARVIGVVEPDRIKEQIGRAHV